MTYYTPPNVFRQPAITKRKHNENPALRLGTHRKSWQTDTTRLESPLLRKVSGDMNDYYTTQQLHSEFWTLPQNNEGFNYFSSLSSTDGVILTSNMRSKDNLQMLTLKADQENVHLAELQTISVPGAPITTASLFPSHYAAAKQPLEHDRMLCSGHQDGVVNLISTSEADGNAKVIKRFNQTKYLKATQPESIDSWLQSKRSSPIRQIDGWNDKGFISIINESLFIYDFNQHKLPLYLQSFTGLEALQVNTKNPHLLSLVGSKFGSSGLSLLDLRCGSRSGVLYSPDTNRNSMNSVSTACSWLDEYTVANAIGDSVKVWDIRSSGSKCTVRGHKGSIKSLKFHQESQRLYTSDDQNCTIAWDLRDISNVSECRLATGFQSICENEISQVKQCGNVVLSPDTSANFRPSDSAESRVSGFTLLDLHYEGSLLTLDSRELGLHTIKNVEKPFVPPRNPRRLQPSLETNMLESDSTMNQESIISQSDNISETTVDVEEFSTPAKNEVASPILIQDHNHKAQSTSIYSLKDFDLSGSTIYNDHIIHEDILL
ncbi:LADA_0G03972g1_1 [Lachancea dasiensis]|uniref:LADA_0G03972g1_1 n=1 Tax=Lachancea dasiensis TaxID=1072105 RepID=A0A1G4JS69_9SACH|nr:LADA_0G03972g1_1 [Lachancea dasiensis]